MGSVESISKAAMQLLATPRATSSSSTAIPNKRQGKCCQNAVLTCFLGRSDECENVRCENH